MRKWSLLLLVLPALAQEATDVSGKRALETVKVLADDAFLGRKSGLEGGRKAEQWMAARLKQIGLEPGYKGAYFHEFKAAVTTAGKAALYEASGGDQEPRKGSYLTDFVTLIYSGKGIVEREVVFAGYGIDYVGLDVKGKIVMAVRGVPPDSGLEEERYIGWKSSHAWDSGAVGFLLVEGDQAVAGTIQEKYHRTDLPAVWLSRKAADDLLKRAEQEDLAAQIRALRKGERRSFPLNKVKVKLTIDARLLKDRPMRNVVGLWPGDPQSDEYVVLGAHLDHVGTDAVNNVYNGADDNASGSSMLLEVARAIAATNKRFKRSILFCWFAAEEQGLTGSRRLVAQPPVPLDQIAVMINVDMVGQGKPILAVGGTELYPRDAQLLENLQVEGFESKPFRSAPNSDHYPFQAAGVPAFFLHTAGPHPNYHRPGDDWQNIKPELLEHAGKFIRRLAERAAGSSENHCRPNRLGEYLWHRSWVVGLDSQQGEGIDFRVEWFDGDAETVMNGLAKDREEKTERTYLPGANVGQLANDLKPTLLLGVRGYAAHKLANPARKLGAVLFAPFTGHAPAREATDVPPSPLLWLEGAPQGDAKLIELPSPILVPLELATKWEQYLKQRVPPWLVVMRLARDTTPEQITDLYKRFGQGRLLLVPGTLKDPAPLIEALLAANMERVTIRGLLGGNFLALLRKVKR